MTSAKVQYVGIARWPRQGPTNLPTDSIGFPCQPSSPPSWLGGCNASPDCQRDVSIHQVSPQVASQVTAFSTDYKLVTNLDSGLHRATRFLEGCRCTPGW